MENKETRWKQRFINFENAYFLLKDGVERNEYSLLEKAGLIQVFELTFELSWKTMKDFLNTKEVDVKFPRDIIKEAFKYELIESGDVWMDMLEKRNLLSHTYDENISNLAVQLIKENYFAAIKEIYNYLKKYIKCSE